MSALVPACAPPVAPLPAPVAAAAPVKKKRRRRRRALVRNEDDSRLYNLMLDVNALRSEVQRLELNRQVLATRALVVREDRLGAMLSTSSRVFQVFQNGYRPSQWRPSQQAFVGSAFDDQVTVSEYATGREGLLEQWRLYSELFLLGVFGVSSLRVIVSDTDESDCIVEALGEFDGRMTREALAIAFPHVVGNRALEEMLLGRQFRCPTRTLLYFDRRGRITRFDANADMVTAMSQLVGRSPELIAALMTHARINEASMIDVSGDDVDIRGGQSQEDDTRRERENIEARANEADYERPEGYYGSSDEEHGARLDSRADKDRDTGLTSHRQSVAFILS